MYGSIQELVAEVILTSIWKVSMEKTNAFMVWSSVSNEVFTYNCCYFYFFTVVKLSKFIISEKFFQIILIQVYDPLFKCLF